MGPVKSGGIQSDGRNVVIGAPLVHAEIVTRPNEPTPSSALGTMLRHLKGVLASAEELKTLLEKQEQEKK